MVFNVVTTTLLFLILVYQKFLLLNEESLILLSFVTFTIFGVYQFSSAVSDELSINSQKLELDLQFSFNQQLILFQYFSKNEDNINLLLNAFESLKEHFWNLNKLTSDTLLVYNKQKLAEIYPIRLIFIKRIEHQSIKLISLLISEKLFTITKIKKFYIKNFSINYFDCLQKISLQESISHIITFNNIHQSEYR